MSNLKLSTLKSKYDLQARATVPKPTLRRDLRVHPRTRHEMVLKKTTCMRTLSLIELKHLKS